MNDNCSSSNTRSQYRGANLVGKHFNIILVCHCYFFGIDVEVQIKKGQDYCGKISVVVFTC